MDARTWSTLKIHEGNHCVITNIILGAGVGPRGNGREARKALLWGDGITCASENTLISNNSFLIL